jgi:hypothetical protein
MSVSCQKAKLKALSEVSVSIIALYFCNTQIKSTEENHMA